jgi:putative oxidoreductase
MSILRRFIRRVCRAEGKHLVPSAGGRPVTTTTTADTSTPAKTGTIDFDSVTRDVGLLAVRATAGLLLAGHGAQKLFGWWGGPDFDFIVNSLAQEGYTPARFFAYLLGWSELVGGLLLALGLLTPLGSAAVIGVMFNAVVGVHWHSGVWAANGGYELPLLLGMVGLAVGFTGPGRLSLDRRWPWVTGGVVPGLVSLGLGLIGALMVMAVKAT